MKQHIITFSLVVASISSMLVMPIASITAVGFGNGSLNGAILEPSNSDNPGNPGVQDPSSTYITINSISTVKTSGYANGTFESGWKWIFDLTIPNQNETSLAMKFDNWLRVGGSANPNSIPVAGNLRFYSAQSSTASSSNSAVYINSSGVYSNNMILTGDLDGGTGRRVQVTVEYKIPSGTPIGGYSTNFGIRAQ